MKKFLFLVLFSLATPLMAEKFSIPDFTADYVGYKGPVKVAVSSLSLKKNSNGYVYRSTSRTVGLVGVLSKDVVTETSNWTLDNSVLKVSKYLYQHKKGKKVKKFKEIMFDWPNMTASTRSHKTAKNLPIKLKAGSIDKFTLQLLMMSDMIKNGKIVGYNIADIGELKYYKFEMLGKKRVKTLAGEYDTILIKRKRSAKGKRATLMWCAPKLNYLPVKVQHINKKGGKFNLVLKKVSGM